MYISRGAEPRNKLYYCDLTSLEGGEIKGVLSTGRGACACGLSPLSALIIYRVYCLQGGGRVPVDCHLYLH